MDEGSRTTAYLERVGSYYAGDVDEVTKFGPVYLTNQEHAERLREVTRAYYRFLAESALGLQGREFWEYHLKHFKAMGYSVNLARVALYALFRIADMIFNPKRTIEGAFRRIATRLRGMRRGAAAARAKPAAG
jgi:hypothetical protein